MGDNGRLSAKQQRAIEALLTEPTTRAAAQAAGVGETTIFRWLAEPAFSTAYRAARSRLLESTLTELQAASTEAVETLREVMNSPLAMPAARVSAARAVLEFSLRAREEIEIEERLRALESAVAPSTAGVKR